MLIYPQLSSGTAAQYPIGKAVSHRSVKSMLEDGTVIALADRFANYIQWRMIYRDLTDREAGSLSDFFSATQGNLQPFLFLDPTANLLQSSSDFTRNPWLSDGIRFDSAAADPFGGAGAFRANNNSSTDLSVAQDTRIPGAAQVCFSVYLRGNSSVVSSLTRTAGSQSATTPVNITTKWQRVYLSDCLPNVNDLSRFAIVIPSGTAIEMFAPQVDAQISPSTYVASSNSCGVFTNARFDMKQLTIIATGPNRNACAVSVRCNLPAGD